MFDSTNRTLAITAERLSKAEIFNKLTKEDLLAIAEFCTEENYTERQAILTEGVPAKNLYVVERGKISLEKKIKIGRHTTERNATISYVGPGNIVGFSTLSSPYTYSTSAICIDQARVIVIDGIQLRTYLEKHPTSGYIFMNSLADIVANRYRQAMYTLTYFLSIVSHELRAPLAAIENYLLTIFGGYAGELNPKQTRMVQRCILRVNDLRVLIGDVVDLARMRPEQIQEDFVLFSPEEVASESIEDTRLAASEKNVKIKVIPPPKFEPIVGARTRIRQVITNLLNNAIKFAPPDSQVTFRAHYNPEQLIFEIQDEGPGIPSEEIPQVFEDFYRASNVGDTIGAGLGLSIAHKIIEAHQGKIIIENIINDGNQLGLRATIIIPRNLCKPKVHPQQ